MKWILFLFLNILSNQIIARKVQSSHQQDQLSLSLQQKSKVHDFWWRLCLLTNGSCGILVVGLVANFWGSPTTIHPPSGKRLETMARNYNESAHHKHLENWPKCKLKTEQIDLGTNWLWNRLTLDQVDWKKLTFDWIESRKNWPWNRLILE